MTDNPFLAGIERQGAIRISHKFILESLEENFGTVPEEVQQRVRRITDEARFRVLIRKAVLSESLEAFLDQMDLTTTSAGS